MHRPACRMCVPDLDILQWDLRLRPAGLEAAFWSTSSSLRSYLNAVDTIACVTITITNIWIWVALYKGSLHVRPPDGWETAYLAYPILNITIAHAQNILRRSRPSLYWSHRRALSYFNIIQRMLILATMRADAGVVCEYANKLLMSRPAWMVVLFAVSGSGALTQVIHHVHFPLSFKASAIMHFGSIVLHTWTYVDVSAHALKLEALRPAVSSICTVLHHTFGTALMLHPVTVRAGVDVCIHDSRWLIVFALLASYALVLSYAYFTERALKVSFLRQKGHAVEDLDTLERALVVGFALILSYACTWVYASIPVHGWTA